MLDQKTDSIPTSNVFPLKKRQKKKLSNLINALHYQKKYLLVTFYHPDHDYYFMAKGYPGPAIKDEISVIWVKDELFPRSLSSFLLKKITLPLGQMSYVFEPENVFLSNEGIQFSLPETTDDNLVRSNRRLCCQTGLYATLTHNGLSFPGCLVNFSPKGLLMDLVPDQNWQPAWLSDSGQGVLTVIKNNQSVYSGIVAMNKKPDSFQFVLQPQNDSYCRYSPKSNRARRFSLTPAPEACFVHPFADVHCALTVSELGSLGFSVEERVEQSVLIPGLIIPDMRICIAGSELFRCMAQVVYRQSSDSSDRLRFGLSILHMTSQEYLKLIRLIHQTEDSKSYVNAPLDPDDLFRFFFETGFIYPEKYAEIASHRKEYYDTYRILYKQPTDVLRYFTYQIPGQLIGHISMLHIYSKTWMNQHHAALQKHRAGIRVVRAICDYINESFRLESSNILYIAFYYRPENKFPRQFFGEFADRMNDKSKVSTDDFAYFKSVDKFQHHSPLSGGWSLDPASPGDIHQFTAFYHKISGGLLPQSLDLTPEKYCSMILANSYKFLGLSRSRKVYALRHNGELCCLVDYQSSSRGLNLSEITNAITFYFLDWSNKDNLSSSVKSVISFFSKNDDQKDKPVMMYPFNAVHDLGFIPDKTYVFWVMDISSGSDDYIDFLNKYSR